MHTTMMLAAVGGLDLDRGVVDAPLLANKSLGTAQDLDEVDLVFDFNVDRQTERACPS